MEVSLDTCTSVVLTHQEKRQIYNRTYLNTENGRFRRAENIKKYYENHPEKKENHYVNYIETSKRCSRDYYAKHREEILAKKKEQYVARALLNTAKQMLGKEYIIFFFSIFMFSYKNST